MQLPYNPALKERARALRKAGNLPEVLFWNQVKKKQFKGLDFDRQKIIGNYIADFYCSQCQVVVEIDGSSHNGREDYDATRDAYLTSLGLTVIRIPVISVFQNIAGVMHMLHEHSAFGVGRESAALEGIGEIQDHPALTGTPPGEGKFWAVDIMDYVYAVLHSPGYREKYKEFLNLNFPRVPYPKDAATFWQLVNLGSQIRQIHLLESPTVEQYITQYPIDGDNVVGKTKYQEGKVYINETQYFDNVPQVAWEFYIGGYQLAQKWLKDRKERTLEFDDILHYQKIIVALTETDRLMKEIDKIHIE
jgi:very-short-patch-repair endonuclease